MAYRKAAFHSLFFGYLPTFLLTLVVGYAKIAACPSGSVVDSIGFVIRFPQGTRPFKSDLGLQGTPC